MDVREMNALKYINTEQQDKKRISNAAKEERDFWKRINQKALEFLEMM